MTEATAKKTRAPGAAAKKRATPAKKAAAVPAGAVLAPVPVLEDARSVAIDLDVIEREGEQPASYCFRHAGRVWELADPRNLDWQVLIECIGNPLLLLQKAMPEGTADDFFAAALPAWKLTALVEDYQRHYGIPSLPELAALSGSSAATARR